MVGAYGDGGQNAIRGEYRPAEAGGLVYALVDPRDHSIFYVGLTRDLEAASACILPAAIRCRAKRSR